jgi:hypothetical protein
MKCVGLIPWVRARLIQERLIRVNQNHEGGSGALKTMEERDDAHYSGALAES